MIHICIPVLKRYDLLRELLLSLDKSETQPTKVVVIDNGQNSRELLRAIFGTEQLVMIHTPPTPLSVAASWNWFIHHVPEERFIINDDIELAPGSLAAMLAARASFVSVGFGFSCFLLRDACVEKVGLFDEAISPGYAYFEDMDYLHRMRLAGVQDDVVKCDVIHKQSQTPAAYTQEEWNEHHRKFDIAQTNFRAKWNNIERDKWEWGPIPVDAPLPEAPEHAKV